MTGPVIRIRLKHLLRALALLLAVTAIPLGIAHTPYLHGRATWLTPQRWGLLRYLDRTTGWVEVLDREAEALQGILEETARDTDANRLLDLGQRGTLALEHLAGVAQQIDSTRMPPAESALHQNLREAVVVELTAAQDVVTCVGSPKPEAIAVAQQDVADARRRVATLQEMIRQQKAAFSRRGDSDAQ